MKVLTRQLVVGGLALMMLMGAGQAYADVTCASGDVTVTLSGQYRARGEYNTNYDFVDGVTNEFLTQRARFGVGGEVADKFKMFLQVQDVRYFGEEMSTMDYIADGLDMHQAWGQYSFCNEVALRIGRQEMMLDNGRLIGNNDWSQWGRSFDGLVLNAKTTPVDLKVWFHKVLEADVFGGDDTNLGGFQVHREVENSYSFSINYVYSSVESVNNLHTFGGIVSVPVNSFGIRGELYYQFGDAPADMDYGAFLGSLGLSYTFEGDKKPMIYFNFDYLSGDDDASDDSIGSWTMLYPSNHLFYGMMDIAEGLAPGMGLMDIWLGFSVMPAEKWSLALDGHYFQTTEDVVTAGDESTDLGFEFDVTAGYAAHTSLEFETGIRWFEPQADWLGDESEFVWYIQGNFHI
jgi:hypothetical protein